MKLNSHALVAIATFGLHYGAQARAVPALASQQVTRRDVPGSDSTKLVTTPEMVKRSPESGGGHSSGGGGGGGGHASGETGAVAKGKSKPKEMKDELKLKKTNDVGTGSAPSSKAGARTQTGLLETKAQAASQPAMAGAQFFNNYMIPCHKSQRNCQPPRELPAWQKPDGTQKPLANLAPADRDALWAAAGVNGTQLRDTMDSYVSGNKSRLHEQHSKQDKNWALNYAQAIELTELNALDANFGQVNKPFKQAGITTVDGDEGFTLTYYNSVTSITGGTAPSDFSVLSLAANGAVGAMVNMYSYPGFDGTPEDERVDTSTLTWQAWKRLTGDQAGNLQYQEFHRLQNMASDNIAALAHTKFPNNVSERPASTMDGEPIDPVGGHGKWVPTDEAFNYLLSSPAIQSTVNMVIDRNPEMKNPYIVEIHTYPKVTIDVFAGAPPEAIRDNSVVIVFGPMPAK